MRYSQLLCPTLKEIPNDAEISSHQLMIRAGLIRKLAAGIYSLLPVGQKVMQKMMTIIREEMDLAGAQEVFLPSIIPAQLWEESGRWHQYGPELLRLKDRHGSDYCYGPTHEEVITELVRGSVKSYRQLPINLYQIQTKFRDEVRPRFGLMRGREFCMKDAYSFHATESDLKDMYFRMEKAYRNIFNRCGLQYKMVEADSGNIGGSASAEFMVTAKTGEDLVIDCDHCDYAANVEAAVAPELQSADVKSGSFRRVATPNQRTIDEVSDVLELPKAQLVKALMIQADATPIMVLLRGDHELNEVKLKRCIGASDIAFIDDPAVLSEMGAVPGFAGPIGLKAEIKVYADLSVRTMRCAVVGANEMGYHLLDVDLVTDCNISEFFDLRNAIEGDLCHRCGMGRYRYTRGIEVGHIFQLGTKYSASMNATFLDASGKAAPYIMGCYGIGVGRTVAAAIEQSHDEKGIIWPAALAPFRVTIIVGNTKFLDQVDAAERIYRYLLSQNIDALLDDRSVSIGYKFNDFELIGIPMAVVVGKQFAQTGQLEVQYRDGRPSREVLESDLLSVILDEN